MNFKTLYFLIESGRPLEMLKEHIAERTRVVNAVRELANEIGGVETIYTSKDSGVLTGVVFSGDIHPDFSKPKRSDRISYPKKGTEWKKRIAAQVGYRSPAQWIASEFGIPLSLSWQRDGKDVAWRCIGIPLMECGFLYLGKDGPYGMWAPDVQGEIEASGERGELNEPAKSFKYEIDGLRQITKDEWDLIVLQNKVEKQRAAA